MKLTKIVLPALLALCLSGAVHAADDASHFLLTPALMQKFKSAEADFKQMKAKNKNKDDEEDDGDEDDSSNKSNSKKDQSVEGIIKRIEADPKIRAALAKHGISPREYGYATFAMLHAGMYVAMESAMDKKGREKLYAGYTREQKANIALMRSYAAEQKK